MSNTPDSQTASDYQVLARKYRPSTFEDMIGQEALVTTLTNAFKTGRIAHAFMLTGVRGIGKTTTARLLARALNYKTDLINSPSVDFSVMGEHCESIMASSHMDVLEMDAASRTGVENMREMLDGVRYSPVSARYKVYIIDEVHMLSTGAFNALLKTLEEPPAHAKFIFATTEIRKVPITVLSRCQRFDLRRVEAGELVTHLQKICVKEDAKVSNDGLGLIARAAEGSVRDALSLLDQAIVQRTEGSDEVSMLQVRDMLGLADRVRVLDLFALAAKGDAKGALTELREQYDHGADPAVIMRDMLDICHEVSRAKALGETAEFDAAPDQIARLTDLADSLSMGQITRLWQMLLKAHADVKMAPTPLAAADMALLRMCVASQLPPPEQAAKMLASAPASTPSAPSPSPAPSSGASAQAVTQMAPAPVAAPQAAPNSAVHFDSLEAFALYAGDNGQSVLKLDIERYVRLIKFEQGAIEFAAANQAPPRLAAQMKAALTQWSGRDWAVVIDTNAKGDDTILELRRAVKLAQDASDKNHPEILKTLTAFPGARLVEIRSRAPSSNIIEADFTPLQKDED
ncbi:MAG: DNA polymerase III subunit gamma/tau [Robiginitomaculum sp.]